MGKVVRGRLSVLFRSGCLGICFFLFAVDSDGDYSLDASELVAGIAAATLGRNPFGASPSARARIFRAAMWSASPACPHDRQQNSPGLLRFPRSVCPQAGQVWLVLAGSTSWPGIPARAAL